MNGRSSLEYYGHTLFDPEVLLQVQDIAEQQSDLSYAELLAQNHIDSLVEQTAEGLYYVQINPTSEYDERRRRVYFTPMATPPDENMLVRALRWFPAQADVPLLIVGSPAGLKLPSQRLSANERSALKQGDLAATVVPLLRHLEARSVEQADFMGFSFGADRALTAARDAHLHGVNVGRAIWAEPVRIVERSLLALARSFGSAGDHLEAAIARSETTALLEAVNRSDIGMARYIGGLLRPTNIAIARGLTRDTFEADAKKAKLHQPDMTATLAWGQRSEISLDGPMQVLSQELRHAYGVHNFNALSIPRMRHADGDDLNLHAAIMLQGLLPRRAN